LVKPVVESRYTSLNDAGSFVDSKILSTECIALTTAYALVLFRGRFICLTASRKSDTKAQ